MLTANARWMIGFAKLTYLNKNKKHNILYIQNSIALDRTNTVRSYTSLLWHNCVTCLPSNLYLTKGSFASQAAPTWLNIQERHISILCCPILHVQVIIQ